MTNLIRYALILGLFLISIVAAGQPSSATIKQLRESTVKVESGSKTSTGFLWNKPNWIVTTLHSIDDTDNIKVTFSGQIGTAKVIKVLKRYDLVLLELQKTVDYPVLITSDTKPEVNNNLYVLGYNGKGNLSNIIDRSLRLGYNHNGKLKGLLSSNLRKELNACKSPDPEINILYFDGSLLPGFSGSPIVDSSGKLVGIADGGLENGAQSISWGIAAQNLSALVKSTEAVENNVCGTTANAVRFSTENVQDVTSIEHITFNNYEFIKTKTRTIAQMQSTVDDPVGLQQLINTFALSNNVNYLSFSYDIYVDSRSGATLCIPEGLELQIEAGVLYATYPDSSMAFIAQPAIVNANENYITRFQTASEQFDNLLVASAGVPVTYEQDPDFSYLQPKFERNGLAVNRKAYRGYVTDYYGNYVPQTYLYETHIGLNDTYLGVAVVHYQSTQEILNLLNTCVFTGECMGNASYRECAIICENYNQFSQLALGVHMSGFSNVTYEN